MQQGEAVWVVAREMPSHGCSIWRDPFFSFLFPVQDVDSRDRRRRELGQPEPQEPPEKVEPSTSWWPVSSAEKRNVTLVSQGEQSSHRGLHVW